MLQSKFGVILPTFHFLNLFIDDGQPESCIIAMIFFSKICVVLSNFRLCFSLARMTPCGSKNELTEIESFHS